MAGITLILPSFVDAAVRVRGYTRKDGTYVAPHYRSNPDGISSNNWSTKGNFNPYTGEEGTKSYPSYNSFPTLPNFGTSQPSYNFYSPPAPSKTSTCPENASHDVGKGSCYCNSGFVADSSKTICIDTNSWCRMQFGAYSHAVGNQCYCNEGTVFDSKTNFCNPNIQKAATLTTVAFTEPLSTEAQERECKRLRGQYGFWDDEKHECGCEEKTFFSGSSCVKEQIKIATKEEKKAAVPATKMIPISAPEGTYKNTYGNQVPRPYFSPTVPVGASARCGDGTYSFSQSRRGTCSHHGGVAEWL